MVPIAVASALAQMAGTLKAPTKTPSMTRLVTVEIAETDP
jgi:hypothetical protein